MIMTRWRRFVGLGDDVCGGDGIVWRPSPVQLDHPEGRMLAWLQFRGRYGGTRSIVSEGFWKDRGEAPRRCSAEVWAGRVLVELMAGLACGVYGDESPWLGPGRS